MVGKSHTLSRTVTRPHCALGQGCKFASLEHQLAKRGARDPKALAAWIGRQKYGAAHYAALAAHGKRYHT